MPKWTTINSPNVMVKVLRIENEFSQTAPAVASPQGVPPTQQAGSVGIASQDLSHSCPFHALQTLLAHELHTVNHRITQELASEIPLIPQLAQHLIAAGGKRLRPLLTLAMARLFSGPAAPATVLAAAVEFIHTATLLHDDVVDESDTRRGQASANALWGNSASVLVGDFLFSRAFQLMVEAGRLDILQILSHAAATITEGEVMQLTDVGNLALPHERYEDMIERKTSALFDAACVSGAMLGTQSSTMLDAVSRFGRYFGTAFQIVDDVLDYRSEPVRMGKSPGDDLKERKVTLPVILAYHDSNEREKKTWQHIFTSAGPEDPDETRDELMEVLGLLHKYDALDRALERAKIYTNCAHQATDAISETLLRGHESHDQSGERLITILRAIATHSVLRVK